jgi:DNA-binding response OmpR family regulator
VKDGRFDLVLLDLAGGDAGFELLRDLRAIDADTPILAVADEAASEDVNEALALGANDVLLKPLYIGVAHARVEMLTGRRARDPASLTAQTDLQLRLDALSDVGLADRTAAASAVVSDLGPYICAPLNALLGAASVLTGICKTPEFAPTIAAIEQATIALDLVIVRALGRADRRSRAPKDKVRVLVADHDTDSRLALHQLLNAAETAVELVEVATGLDAALALDAGFFDLILLNHEAPEALAGVRAIRKSERENNTRRTPVLAFGVAPQEEGKAVDAGADLCMAEPPTAAALLSTLAEALVREAEDVRAVA